MTRIGIRLIALLAALMLLPSVALAQVPIPTEPVALTYWVLQAGGYLLAAALLFSRALPVLKPLVQRLPADWRWLPGALGAAALPLQAMLPGAESAETVVLAVLAAVGAFLAARDAGAKPHDHDEPEAQARAEVRSSKRPPPPPVVTMLVLLAALGLTSCAAMRPAVNVVDAVCTLGLLDAPAVQASATDRGIPLAELAALLCSVPAVYDAWEAAHQQRQDPRAAAVREAERLGLL